MKRIIAIILAVTLIFSANSVCIFSNALTAKTINVKSYGANGADTKDDTDAFQKAFDIAKSGKVKLKIIVPKGNYYIGTPSGKSARALWIYSNTTLDLTSGAVLYRQKASPNTYIIEADGKSNITILGGTFNGNVANTKYAKGLVSLRTISNIKFQNINFKNYCGTHAVLLDGPIGLSVTGCSFSGFKLFTGSASDYKKQTSSSTYWSAEALHIDFVEPTSSSAGRTVKNVSVSGCKFNGVPSGVGTHHVYSSLVGDNIKIYNNTFTNCYFHCCNTSGFKNFEFYNNKATNTPTLIHSENTVGKVYKNTLNNSSLQVDSDTYNKVYKFGTGGFPIETLSGVDVRNAKTSSGINKINCSNVEIYNNSITVGNYYPAVTPKTNGIWSLYEAQINAHDNFITGAEYRGIYVDTGKATLTNNGITNCNIGIYLNETKGSSITDNKLISMANRGMHTLLCENTDITENYIQFVNSGRAITVEGAKGTNNINNNTVFDSTGHSIYVIGSQINEIDGNIISRQGKESFPITINKRDTDGSLSHVKEVNSNQFFGNSAPNRCIHITGDSEIDELSYNRSDMLMIYNERTISIPVHEDNDIYHVHTFDLPIVSTAHTDSFHSGYDEHTCSDPDCGFTFRDGYSYPIVHRYSKTVVAPTYFAAGYTLNECDDCGYTFKSDSKAKLTVPAVSGYKLLAVTANSMKVGWSKASGVDGYVVFLNNSGWKRYKKITSNATTSITIGKLSAGKNYPVIVKAYKTVDGKEVLSAKYSTFNIGTNPAKVSFSVSSPAKGTAKVSWKKVAGATGYVIYYKATAKAGWSKIGTAKSSATSFTKKSLKKGTRYFTVRAVKAYGGRTYQSAYAAKAVEIK